MVARFNYADYEFSIRNPSVNREKLAEYVGYFAGCRRVLDVACGQGIFLELLAQEGIRALGVDRSPSAVATVRRQGGTVVERDVLSYLEETEEVYDGVFCSHFLEHLPFDEVLRFVELLVPRLASQGTLVVVVPNPESIRMQLFGFWRDPEHVRFYHPELLEAMFRHSHLKIIATNREEIPSAIGGPTLRKEVSKEDVGKTDPEYPGLRSAVRNLYSHLLRLFNIAPYHDMLSLGRRIQLLDAKQQALLEWSENANEALNQMWAWPDDVHIVCRKNSN